MGGQQLSSCPPIAAEQPRGVSRLTVNAVQDLDEGRRLGKSARCCADSVRIINRTRCLQNVNTHTREHSQPAFTRACACSPRPTLDIYDLIHICI